MMDTETWKDVYGWEGVYKVSNQGRIMSFKSNKNGRVMSIKNKKGCYLSFILCAKGRKSRSVKVHRLVAETFIPNHENKPEVNHKDSNRQNNKASNLEWVTHKENMDHALENSPHLFKNMNTYNRFVRPRLIVQRTLGGRFIETFINSKEAEKRTGVCHRNILQVAGKTEYKPGKTRKQAGGYVWEFAR